MNNPVRCLTDGNRISDAQLAINHVDKTFFYQTALATPPTFRMSTNIMFRVSTLSVLRPMVLNMFDGEGCVGRWDTARTQGFDTNDKWAVGLT